VERVLVTGVSGRIGAALLPYFESQGAQIVRMVRRAPRGPDQIQWDPLKPVSAEAVSGFDAVIHLAGESIVGRWTAAKKKAMRDSRVLGTRRLSEALAQAKQRPEVFICASAIGIYGDRGDEILTEASGAGNGFLAELARDWEKASGAAIDAGIRTVNIRIGLVLSSRGGALEKMLPPFKLGLGGRIGSGRQWWSWIHVDDIVGAMHHAIRNPSLSGPVNFTAPGAVQNTEFTGTLAAALSRPAIFPVPAFAARLAFGEMADELLLAGQRVEPAKLISSGYPFRFPTLKQSLKSLNL